MGEKKQPLRAKVMSFMMNMLKVDDVLCSETTFAAQREMRVDLGAYAATCREAAIEVIHTLLYEEDPEHEGDMGDLVYVPFFVESLFEALNAAGQAGPGRTRELYTEHCYEFKRAYTPEKHRV